MREDCCSARMFRPNSRGYRVTRDAVLMFGIAAGVATYAEPSLLWICAALLLFGIGLALVSARLMVGPDGVALKVFWMTVAFPAGEIERDRFDELAFMDLFQVSLRNGRFMLIPRWAFADTMLFDAIVALTDRPATSRSENGADKARIAPDSR
jgi:hypothetical protein